MSVKTNRNSFALSLLDIISTSIINISNELNGRGESKTLKNSGLLWSGDELASKFESLACESVRQIALDRFFVLFVNELPSPLFHIDISIENENNSNQRKFC